MSTQMPENPKRPIVIKRADVEEKMMLLRGTSLPAGHPKEHKRGFWDQFLDQRLVFQMKGPQTIIGTFVEKTFDLLKIKDVSVEGLVYAVKDVEWMFIDPLAFAYFHLEGDPQRYKFFPKKQKKQESTENAP